MAAKNDIDITIGGKTYTLSGVESEAYLREVAAYLNEKLKGFSDDASYWRLPNDMRSIMLQLNLADDYFKERSRVEELEAQVQELTSHRDRALQELDVMQGEAREAASRISTLESDAAGLRDQAQRAAAAENTAAKRFGAEKSRAEKLTEEMEALRKSKAESDKAVERFRKELAQTKDNLQGQLANTRKELTGQLQAAQAESAARQKALDKAQAENKTLSAQLNSARQSEDQTKKKLAAFACQSGNGAEGPPRETGRAAGTGKHPSSGGSPRPQYHAGTCPAVRPFRPVPGGSRLAAQDSGRIR